MLAVLTADQRGSRHTDDRVPEALAVLERVTPYRAFERTAGDEVQGVLTSAASTLDAVEALVRAGAWSIGLGLGAVEEPLPASTRAGRGEAFVRARKAVEAAKNTTARLAVVGPAGEAVDRLETVLVLWVSVLRRRTPRGWEVVDLVGDGLTHEAAAARLGITQSAVSQRLSAAGVQESVRGRRLALDLLADLIGTEPG
ncbi:MAG: hypothetical protein JWO46_2039 [Nocardioidaceae bacterium]|nr:hypothetical protein [Nocardioidaceae bacterium]